MSLIRVVSEVCTVNLQLQIVPVLFATDGNRVANELRRRSRATDETY